ncbi:hypothetical protein MLD38_027575 [Melastoma candidum]|uniref:Uncharacterized protein n=1 Tax=Melastoma candidum TaxID=119954 RepID=A0ACB9P7Y0_9MYRT|nr:hypothetical protein MLD38_027575 [Melastoma candidum]
MGVLVELLQPLTALLGGKPRHDGHVPDAPDTPGARHHDAALYEQLVRLGVIEAADEGPDKGEGGVDGAGDEGATLVEGEVGGGMLAGHGSGPQGAVSGSAGAAKEVHSGERAWCKCILCIPLVLFI